MATFAPVVAPTNDPNYMNYSKPISDIQGDKSMGLLLKGLGEAIEGGVAVTDQIIKSDLDDQIRTGVEKQRDAWTSALTQYADMQAGAGVVPSNQSQAEAGIKAPLSLEAEQNLPANVKAVANRVQSIGSAMSQNGGKSNDTLYTGALASLRKQMVVSNPGYVSYIDQKIAEVSGINPANAYMRNLLEDVNRNAQGTKSEVDKAIALGRQYLGYDPGMPAYIEAVRQNLPNSIQNLESRINQVAGSKVKFDEMERVRKLRDWQREDDTYNQTHQFSSEIRSNAKMAWDQVVDIPGLNSPRTIQQLIDDQRAGRISLTDEQNGQLLQAATLAYDTWKRQSVDVMRARGYTKSIPKKQDRDAIIADEGIFFTDQIEAIKNKEYGTMFGNQRRFKSINDDSTVQLLDDPDMGTFWRLSGAVRQVGGDGWQNFIQAEALKAGVTSNLKNFAQSTKMKIATPVDPRKPGDSRSIYEDVKRAQEAKLNPNTGVYDDLVGNVKYINLDTPPQGVSAEQLLNVKRNIVDYTFNPEKNAKLVDRFSKDFYDSDGVYHPGKFAMYDTLTQRKTVDSIWDMKDASSWQKYRDWNELSFRKLFGESVGDLNGLMKDNQNYIITWNNDTKQFGLESGQFGPTRTPEEAASLAKVRATDASRITTPRHYLKAAEDTINTLNKGLRNLAYMHDKEGKDTSAYLMDYLTTLGFSPNSRLQGVGLPQRIVNAIANSEKKIDRLGEAFDAARGK